MKQWVKFLGILFLFVSLLVGCGKEETKKQEPSKHEECEAYEEYAEGEEYAEHEEHGKDEGYEEYEEYEEYGECEEADTHEEDGKKPVLEADVKQEGETVTISWNTDLNVIEDHYGSEHAKGEGHAHIKIDGQTTHRMKKIEELTINNLSPGEHKIEVSLQKNNHKPYGVKKEFTVTIP